MRARDVGMGEGCGRTRGLTISTSLLPPPPCPLSDMVCGPLCAAVKRTRAQRALACACRMSCARERAYACSMRAQRATQRAASRAARNEMKIQCVKKVHPVEYMFMQQLLNNCRSVGVRDFDGERILADWLDAHEMYDLNDD